MAYATVTDMVHRFGQAEMIRLSATAETLPVEPNAARIEVALDDATAVIEMYLRSRYALPISPVPREITRACCILARFDLSQGDGKTPSDDVKEQASRTLAWLEALANGTGELAAAPATSITDARVQDRDRAFRGVGLP
jgi:phage gp36-like protein